MISIFQNHQVKKSFLYLIIASVVISITSICAYNIGVSRAYNQLFNEEANIIGAVNRIDSDVVKEVVSVVTKGNTSEELITEGKSVLSRYGYDESTLYKMNDFKESGLWVVIASILVIIILMVLKEVLSYREFYRGIDKLNSSLERIIEGDYTVRIEDEKEGQFYVLTMNINKLVEIVNGSISSLKEEKVFLKEIISDISHQLKTPLSTLSIYNELIEGKMLGEKEEQEILVNSRNVLDKMEWLIINLLKLAKFEVKAVEFNKSKTNIKDVLEGAVRALHGKSLENNNIININSDDVFLNVDGEWVEEGFINIIKNAIEHSENGGQINIDVNDNIVWTKITVEDFGEGIEDRDLNRIFKRFYKSKNSKSDSVGIGLSLSKSIFEGNGATIVVCSSPSVGTKFTVTFLKI